MSERTIELSPDVRYSVSLMASTFGSADAWRMNSSTEVENELVRVVHEHVALAQHREEVDRRSSSSAIEPVLGDRQTTRVLEVGPVEAVHRPEPAEVEGAVEQVDVVVVDVELALEQLAHLVGDMSASISRRTARPKRRRRSSTSTAASRSSASSSSSVRSALRVTRKASWPSISMPGEERVEVGGDHLLERHEALAVGHHDEAGQQQRHLHPGEAALLGDRVAHDHGEVERQVGDVRERVTGVDGERREHREDALLEHLVEVLAVVVVELVPAARR